MNNQDELPDMPAPVPPKPPEPFTIEGSVENQINIVVDLAGLIRLYPQEYAAVDMRSYMPYERPMAFLHEFLEEDWVTQHSSPHVTLGYDEFEFSENRRWDQNEFDALCQVCPEARLP